MKHILTLTPLSTNEAVIYSTLRGLCNDKGWSYNWLKTMSYPIHYKNYVIDRYSFDKEYFQANGIKKWGKKTTPTEFTKYKADF